MSDDELDAIEARAAAATPGPWSTSGIPYDDVEDPAILAPPTPMDEYGLYVAQTVYDQQSSTQRHKVDEDTLFIAAARQDVPALVAEVRRLRSILAERT